MSEKAWNWLNNSSGNKCSECDNLTSYLDFGRGYSKYCSRKCQARSKEIQNKRAKTVFDKYGVCHFSKTLEFKDKCQKIWMEKYGVVNPGQISERKQLRGRRKQETYFNGLLAKIDGISKPNFEFTEYSNVRDKCLSWTCLQCNLEFTSDTFNKIPRCPKCYPQGCCGKQSSIEKDVLAEIQQFYTINKKC